MNYSPTGSICFNFSYFLLFCLYISFTCLFSFENRSNSGTKVAAAVTHTAPNARVILWWRVQKNFFYRNGVVSVSTSSNCIWLLSYMRWCLFPTSALFVVLRGQLNHLYLSFRGSPHWRWLYWPIIPLTVLLLWLILTTFGMAWTWCIWIL